MLDINKVHNINCLDGLKLLEDESIDMVITSPPYWGLRDYGVDGQLGLEPKFQEYINNLCNIFDEVHRVLKTTGTCWVNIGDTYGGSGDKKGFKDPKNPTGRNGQSKSVNKNAPQKCLLQIPSRFAIEMIDRGWILRNEIIWHKPNAMPQPVKDRFTVDFEKIFFFSKNKKYYFEQQKEKAKYAGDDRGSRGDKRRGTKCNSVSGKTGEYKNKRCVWSINTRPFKEAHFAVYPPDLIETPIKAGCPEGGVVLDPFMGSGTSGLIAKKLNRNYIGFELNPEYCELANSRINSQ
jgi:DNA modification methylase